MNFNFAVTHVCPACVDMNCLAPGECDDCGAKLVPAPALPAEVWATPRDVDYLGEVRAICGGVR